MKKLNQLVILITFVSCNYDQVTTEYSTFEEANNDNFFEKGWIPIELVNENISDIYLQNDIDINTFIFSFRTLQLPFSFTEESVIQKKEIELHGITIPKWWNQEIINQPRITFQTDHGEINIVQNKQLNKVYGWGQYGR